MQPAVCINLDTLIYSGYGLTIEPIASGRYRLTVSSLNLPLEKFGKHYADKRYQQRPVPAIPAPLIISERQPFAIPIGDGFAAKGRTDVSIELSREPFGTPWRRLLYWLGFPILAG